MAKSEITKEEAIRCLTSLAELRRKYGGMQTFQDEAQCLEMGIEALEQEPKTGQWIALENRFELGDRLKCSECGQVFVVGDDVSRNFCPNCGAKMESEE